MSLSHKKINMGEWMRSKKLKVYGIYLFEGNREGRCVVAAYTQKQAAEILNVSIYYLRQFGSQTWNELELKTALAEPFKRHWINARSK
jgi:hypothetical protein